MVQFAAFDPATRAAAQAATHAEVALSPDSAPGDALSAALERENAVAILPAGEGSAFLVTVRKRAPRPAEQASPAPQPVAQTAPAPLDVARWQSPAAVGYSAGGFLGLLDEPVYQEEKKSWWRRALG